MGFLKRAARYLLGAALVLAGAGYLALELVLPAADAIAAARAAGEERAGEEAVDEEPAGEDAVAEEVAGEDALDEDVLDEDALDEDAVAEEAAGEDAVGEEPAEQSLVELARIVLASAEPKTFWIAGGLVLAGFVIARPPFGGRARPRAREGRRESKKRPAGRAALDLKSHDPAVRLRAAEELLAAADPPTIPALVGALEDSTTEVRGQACEALARMTGETFDFLDIAPEPVRAESVARWRAWWKEHKGAILAGTDPRELAGRAVPVSAGAQVVPSSARRPRSKTSRTTHMTAPPAAEAPVSAPPAEPELPLPEEDLVPVEEVVEAEEVDDIEPIGDDDLVAVDPATAIEELRKTTQPPAAGPAAYPPVKPTTSRSGRRISSPDGRNVTLDDVLRKKKGEGKAEDPRPSDDLPPLE